MNVQLIYAGVGFGMKSMPSLCRLLAVLGVISAIVGAISILFSLSGGELMTTSTHADVVAFKDARHISQAAAKAKLGSVPSTTALVNTQIDQRMVKLLEEENSKPERDYESTLEQTIRIVRDVSLVAASAFEWEATI